MSAFSFSVCVGSRSYMYPYHIYLYILCLPSLICLLLELIEGWLQ